MIDSQRGAKRQVGYNHLISNKRECNNCFIKNHQQILLDFADFAWLEQLEGNLVDAISRVWYNYRLTHSASELSGFTCTSSLTMNEKIQYRTRPPSAVLKISSSLLVNECR